MNTFGNVLVLLLISMAGCGKADSATQPSASNAEPDSARASVRFAKTAKSPNLGGGYKDVKWGMTVRQVIDIVKKTMDPSEIEACGDYAKADLCIKLGDGQKAHPRSLTFTFDRPITGNRDTAKLVKAFYMPNLDMSDEEGVESIIQSLRQKFGPCRQSRSGDEHLCTWSDGVTEIVYSKYDREAAIAAWGRFSVGAHQFSVRYALASYLSEQEREEAEALRKERQQQEAQRKKYGQDL